MKPSELLAAVGALAGPWLDVRALRKGARPRLQSVPEGRLNGLGEWIQRQQKDGRCIYFGVAPRTKRGPRGKDAIQSLGSVWADIDAEKEGRDQAEVQAELDELPCPPSYVVATGHGLHAYWCLPEPCADLDRAEALMRRLAALVGGDPSVCDAARILRVPGTCNCKDPSDIRICSIVSERGDVYTLDALELMAPAPASAARPAPPPRRSRLAELVDEARARLTIDQVYQGIDWTSTRGTWWEAACPLPGHPGDRTAGHFHVSSPTLGWVCHSHCGKGSVLGYLAGGQEPTGAERRRLSINLCRLAGLDTSEVEDRRQEPEAPRARPDEPPRELPRIQVGGVSTQAETRDAARAALVAAQRGTEPRLYVRAGLPVRVIRSDLGPRIEIAPSEIVHSILMDSARWVRVCTRKDETFDLPADIPRWLPGMIALDPPEELPHIEAVAEVPIATPQRHLVTAPGYCPEARVYLAPRRLCPQLPSLADARDQIDEVIADFPLDQPSRAHVYAALLLPMLRAVIDGPTPLHAILAPVQGAGKGLLAQVIAIIGSGRKAPITPLPSKDSETGKAILSILMRGDSVVVLDNVTSLSSNSFAAALTSEIYSDRLLGVSRMLSVRNRALWLLTGNNPDMSADLARRSVLIRIDSAESDPSSRPASAFAHHPLLSWVGQHQPRFTACLARFVRTWQEEGVPLDRHTALGSFEAWAGTMGAVLGLIGVSGLLGNRADLRTAADSETGAWEAFVGQWWERFAGAPVATRDLLEIALAISLPGVADRTGDDSRKRMSLGRLLARRHGRIWSGGLRTVRCARGAGDGAASFRVERSDAAQAGA